MNYGEIKKFDIADGLGVRVSLFVSGCRNHCKGCFNRDTWDFNYGKPFTKETEEEIFEAMNQSYITGFSLLGGEPFEVENQRVLLPFLKRLKKRFPSKDIWCWTGYILEQDIQNLEGKAHCEVTEEMLGLIDMLVDGPFIMEKKNISLQFRGSINQRIIRMKPFRILAQESSPFPVSLD